MGRDLHIGWDILENGGDINMEAQADSRQWDGGDSLQFFEKYSLIFRRWARGWYFLYK